VNFFHLDLEVGALIGPDAKETKAAGGHGLDESEFDWALGVEFALKASEEIGESLNILFFEDNGVGERAVFQVAGSGAFWGRETWRHWRARHGLCDWNSYNYRVEYGVWWNWGIGAEVGGKKREEIGKGPVTVFSCGWPKTLRDFVFSGRIQECASPRQRRTGSSRASNPTALASTPRRAAVTDSDSRTELG
jgi:hypothetical protein